MKRTDYFWLLTNIVVTAIVFECMGDTPFTDYPWKLWIGITLIVNIAIAIILGVKKKNNCWILLVEAFIFSAIDIPATMILMFFVGFAVFWIKAIFLLLGAIFQ